MFHFSLQCRLFFEKHYGVDMVRPAHVARTESKAKLIDTTSTVLLCSNQAKRLHRCLGNAGVMHFGFDVVASTEVSSIFSGQGWASRTSLYTD